MKGGTPKVTEPKKPKSASDADVFEKRKNRFRILVCIDGSEESYRALRYASLMGRGDDCDIVLLYVRPIDQGLHTGGLQVRVARQNLLDWGLELPGMKHLKKGLDILMEEGQLEDDWGTETTHTDIAGDPLGDNKVEYFNENGKSIVLKLKTASDPASGILEQYHLGPYQLIIMGASGRSHYGFRSMIDPAVAEKVAVNAPCSVLVARDLKPGDGHLVCTDGSQRSFDTVRKDAEMIVRRFANPLMSVLSVALDEESRADAEKAANTASDVIRETGIEVQEAIVKVGDPVEQIVETGQDYSLIVMSDSGTSRLKRLFLGSVASKVLEKAKNSVLVIR